jgi:cardiolipin synthase
MTVAVNADRPFCVDGHRLTLLPSGRAAHTALIALIDGARARLQLLFYRFSADSCGAGVRERLIAAAARGVAVSLIVDDFGSLETPASFFAPLEAAGIRFSRFQPRLFQRYLLRNHQKLAIADDALAVVGSFNIGNPHLLSEAEGAWHDIGLRVEGDAARRLGHYFDALAQWVRTPGQRLGRLSAILEAANECDGRVRWVIGGPSRGYNNYVRQLRREFRSARALDLMMAYFAPNPRLLFAVKRIARAGCFRLIAAEKTDVALSRAAAWHTYRSLLKAGAQIYEYRPRLLHAKLIIVDDAVFIGSGNFDVRSLYVNLEVMLRIEDAAFAARARSLFEAELERSTRIDLVAHRARRSWYKRLLWRAAYFLVASVDLALSKRFAR